MTPVEWRPQDDADAVDLVRQWHDSVNAEDVEGALAICHPDVAIGGPRGVATGVELVRQWLVRTGIHLEPQETSVDHGRVTVRELARWRALEDAPDGAPTGDPVQTWVVFDVDVPGGLITALRRYETAEDAASG